MFLRILLNQARHRGGVALLVFLAITALVTLYVYSSNTTRFANRSMQLVMKNMGHNLVLFPKEADAGAIHGCTENQLLFSDDTTRRMSESLDLLSKYYVSVLQARVSVEGHDVILTGIEPVRRRDETPEKSNLTLPLDEHEARLGHESARKLKKHVGDSVSILGESFRIVEIFPPKAGLDDCRVYVNLKRCQTLLGKEGQINLILAFLCLHGRSLDGALALQEKRLAETFPDFRQISKMDIAQGRYLARITTRKSLSYFFGIVAIATAVVVAVSGLQEVHDRRQETGILIAMGTSHAAIVSLYLAKILVVALLASVAGFCLGSFLAIQLNAPLLVVNTRPVSILWQQLPSVVGLTCAVALVAELIPIVKLLSLDPNTILSEQ